MGIIFDTDNIESSTQSALMPSTADSLHMHHHTTDHQFLTEFFPKGHPIYILFSESFFYVV